LQKTVEKQIKIDLTEVLTQIIEEVVARYELFSHIEMSKIIVSLASNRSNGRGGIYGKLVPLKFENGAEVIKYKSHYYSMQKVIYNEVPLLYIVYFYTPKFFDLSLYEKLRVILHELYHINPNFNGDIRRMGKKKIAHGSSRESFNLNFKNELDDFYEYIKKTPYVKFLLLNSLDLNKNFRTIVGTRIKLPKAHLVK